MSAPGTNRFNSILNFNINLSLQYMDLSSHLDNIPHVVVKSGFIVIQVRRNSLRHCFASTFCILDGAAPQHLHIVISSPWTVFLCVWQLLGKYCFNWIKSIVLFIWLRMRTWTGDRRKFNFLDKPLRGQFHVTHAGQLSRLDFYVELLIYLLVAMRHDKAQLCLT